MLGFDALGKLALGQLPGGSASAVSADAGAFVLSGQDAVFTVAMPGEAATFTLSGQAAGLAVSMPAGTGVFTLTGQTALTPAVFRLTCGPFVASEDTQFGIAALGAIALGQLYRETDTAISFELSGGDVVFRHTMAASVGAFVYTGQDARLVEGNVLTAEHVDFTLSFPAFATSIVLPMAAGSYAVTVQGDLMELARRSPKLRRFPRVGSTTVSARSRGAGVKVRAYGG